MPSWLVGCRVYGRLSHEGPSHGMPSISTQCNVMHRETLPNGLHPEIVYINENLSSLSDVISSFQI